MPALKDDHKGTPLPIEKMCSVTKGVASGRFTKTLLSFGLDYGRMVMRGVRGGSLLRHTELGLDSGTASSEGRNNETGAVVQVSFSCSTDPYCRSLGRECASNAGSRCKDCELGRAGCHP